MIPVFEPSLGDAEHAAVMTALRCGEISGTFGKSIPAFEQEFAAYCGCRYGVAVSSGTAALHLAVAAAGIGPGDEVLVSTATNIATALAVVHNGAVPVPIDAEDGTWNLDLERLAANITPRTKAVIPVHLYGRPVDMDRLATILQERNLIVIEDCAQAHGATVRGRKVGTFGRMGCFSFYANKIITTGEGGMVVTDDEALAEHLRLLRNLAFTQPRFHHEYAGYNFRLTGIQAALGRAQLRRIEDVIQEKRRVAATYQLELEGMPGLRLVEESTWARSVYWMNAIEVTPAFGRTRDELADALRQHGVETRTFFCPMNQQPCLRRLPGFCCAPCPVADRIWQTGMYLPSSPTLSAETIRNIANMIGALAARRNAA